MNPIETTYKIKEEYVSYLQSILKVKDPEITKSTYAALKDHVFVKGPFLEATLPYITGGTIRGLMSEKVASPEFLNTANSIDLDRPLYTHQEKAFRKVALKHRNVIVATGTGSGKTESFLYPILNRLFQEKEEGRLSPGVRALLLYPMNALANDQMKRLRELLATYPEITFGRYTGETVESEAKAIENYVRKKEEDYLRENPYAVKDRDYSTEDLMPLRNERISRESMREDPPHIILTNYAMLEYLLIRPSDNVFFDGIFADEWKFIVLDEAHTYKGATGTEIALLLRRLKQKVVGNQRGKIQCIATSATLGSKEALPDLAKFASDIFDEEFIVDDIITSERKKREILETKYKGTLENYQEYKKQVQTMDKDKVGAYLFSKLAADLRIEEVLRVLESKPKELKDVANVVFKDLEEESSRIEAMILLIELGVLAKKDKDSAALLPARYHLFVKALEGVYIALYPTIKAFLDRKELYKVNGREVPVFELANCKGCGQEYLVGINKLNKLKPGKVDEKAEYYLLTNEEVGIDEPEYDEDDTAYENTNLNKMDAYELCTACGTLHRANRKNRSSCCDIADSGKLIKVYKMVTNKAVPNTCTSCGAVSNNLIKRFMTANQPATYVIASSLYSMIPAEKSDQKDEVSIVADQFFEGDPFFTEEIGIVHEENGRKLLVFSDNRQEAAFFAAYMDNKYNQLMWRRLILQHLKALEEPEAINDLMIKLRKPAEDFGLFASMKKATTSEKETLIQTYVMKELMSFERNQGLEGSGYLKFSPDLLSFRKGIEPFTAKETEELLKAVLDTLRLNGIIDYPTLLDPESDAFAPRNRAVFFRLADSKGTIKGPIMSFVPTTKYSNRRLDYIQKILCRRGYSLEESKTVSMEILRTLYGLLINPQLSSRVLTPRNLNQEGLVYQLNFKSWKAQYIQDSDKVYRCNKCGKIAHTNISNVCPEFRCHGLLEEVEAHEYRNDPYYSKVYQNSKIIPMISREHTAQLNKEKAGDLQKEFESGKVNVLSCSTTFEMGVDVGQLEAILLRNVPPETANYVQRAGRAGRRTSATAFSVTYARRSSHDLHYFANPSEIISGKIKSPYIELTNEKIADRHLNSIVMSWFFKNYPSFFNGQVSTLIDYENQGAFDVVQVLNTELSKKPIELLEIIEEALGSLLCQKLKVREWGFIERLVGESGILKNAIEQKKSDIEYLEEIKHKNFLAKKSTDGIQKTIHTYLSESVLSFLASSGVLPKYGFPVDVVKLDIRNDQEISLEVDLSRDLKMAISEFAPGSEVIAAGKIWTSHVLNKVRGKEWPAYRYYECITCNRVEIPENMTIAVDDEAEERQCSRCNGVLKPKRFFVPIFGFSTMSGQKPKSVGETRPDRYYSTKIQFGGFGDLDIFQKEERKEDRIIIGNNEILSLYSPQGKLVVLNQGKKHKGLLLCKTCGHASNNKVEFVHKNKFGEECPNTFFTNAALGHLFHSDILKLKFPQIVFNNDSYEADKDQWSTLLYAILEGAADVLGISRSDINGCVDWSERYPVLILFDEAAGGAGHVKRVHQNLESVLKGAYKRVDGHCGCGHETSCYGCLQSYSNQMEHDILARGLAKDYLEWLINSKSEKVNKNTSQSISIPALSKAWEEVLELLSSKPYEFAWDLAVRGDVEAPDEVGYELFSENQGVLGYEAEMVWHNGKIAVLNDNTSPECVDTFEQNGWHIFFPENRDKEKLIQTLIRSREES